MSRCFIFLWLFMLNLKVLRFLSLPRKGGRIKTSLRIKKGLNLFLYNLNIKVNPV